jgi:tetratricopeptide (TPR) repeat protein
MVSDAGRNKSVLIPVAVLAVLIWGLHFLPFLFPQARLWGFNHLLFLPAPFTFIYLFCGLLLTVVVLFPSLRNPAAGWFEIISGLLMGGRYYKRWLLFAVLTLPLFWFLRLTLFVLGDSFAVISNIGSKLPVVYKWSEIGAVYTAYLVSKLLPFAGLKLGAYSYGFISVLSGSVTVYFFLVIAYELGRDRAERFFIFCLSIFAGWMLLFFGYAENYPILWLFVTGYIYFSVRCLTREGSLITPAVFLGAALILHLQGLFFLASFAVLVYFRIAGSSFYRKYRNIFWSVVLITILAGGAVFIRLYRESLELRLYIMPFLKGRPATLDYWLVSPTHLADIGNQLLLLVPVLPILIVLSWRIRRNIVHDKINQFLLWLSLGGMFFLFIIEPKLGMGRDWDLFALSGLAPMLLLVRNIHLSESLRKKIYPILTVLSLILVLPFLATYLRYQPAVDGYKYLLNLDLPRSRSGIGILRDMYKKIGDTATADSLEQVLVDAFPAHTMVPKAFALIEEGRYDAAMDIVDSIARYEPYSVELMNLRGTIYYRQGKYDSAFPDMERAARMGRYDSRFLVNLAQAYLRMERYDAMLETMRKAQALAPQSTTVLNGLMAYFFMTRKYDSAMVYAEKVYDLDSSSGALYAMAFSSYNMGDRAKAVEYFKRYVETAPDGAKKEQVKGVLGRLSPNLLE